MSATLILGEPHIGRSQTLGKVSIGSNINSRIADQFKILDWVLLKALQHNVSRIICTGDVFHDTKPSTTLISLLIQWLKQVSDNNIYVDILLGNHDLIRSGQTYYSPLDIITAADIYGVEVHKNITTIHTEGASFTLMPFRDRRSMNANSQTNAVKMLRQMLPYELASIDRDNAKVMIGHLTIEGSLYVGDEIDDVQNEIFCPLDMFSNYDFTWNGHIHKPQELSKAPYISHIGSMDLSDFGETDHTKIAVVFDSSQANPVKHLELPTRPMSQITVSIPDNVIDATEFVLSHIKNQQLTINNSIVKLNIAMENSHIAHVDRSKIESCLTDLGAFHITRISEERKVAQIKKTAANEGIDNTVNEKTAINMYADSVIEEHLRSDFISLANDIVKECM